MFEYHKIEKKIHEGTMERDTISVPNFDILKGNVKKHLEELLETAITHLDLFFIEGHG